MTASAITAAAPTSARAATRNAARSDAGDPADSPFASLIGAAPDAEPPAAKKAGADGDADTDTDTETPVAASSEPGQPSAELPAWLLALRAPPPPAAATSAAVAEVGADPVLAGAGGKTVAGITPLSAEHFRTLRGLETPPTQTPPAPVPAPEAGWPVAGALAAEPVAVTADALPALPDVALDARQTAALDAAIATMASGSEPAAVTVATPAPVERAVSAPVVAAAPSPPPELSNLTDAFGETLSLDGRDAALRLGERLRWLTESGVHEARMQLHPRELGSVDVRIRIEGQGASVWFGAEHPAARAALESTLPQLRQQLAAEGFSLDQAQVGGQGSERRPDQQAGHGERHRDSGPSSAADRRFDGGPGRADSASAGRSGAPLRVARGLVDRYA